MDENPQGRNTEESAELPRPTEGATDPLDTILKTEAPQPHRIDEIVEGPIISRGTAAIFVDLGARGTGIVYGREFFLVSDILKNRDIGDTVSAKVIDPENDEGYVELSVSAAVQEIAWEMLQRTYAEKGTMSVTVDAANRGGLMATVNSVKAFLPVSQLAPEHYPRVEGGDKEKILEALRAFIGKTLQVKIINLEPQSEKLILSERAVMEEELRKELKNFHAGDTVDGTISGVVDFGIFIRFGPDEKLEGLAHISELSWGTIENIRGMFTMGEKVQAKIIDLEGDRASLSLKALSPDPWKKISDRLAQGQVIQGRVVRFTPFGAFVEVAEGVQGIVRIASFPDEASMQQMLTIGSSYAFTILSSNPLEHRMQLIPQTAEKPKVEESSDEKKEASQEKTPEKKPEDEPEEKKETSQEEAPKEESKDNPEEKPEEA